LAAQATAAGEGLFIAMSLISIVPLPLAAFLLAVFFPNTVWTWVVAALLGTVGQVAILRLSHQGLDGIDFVLNLFSVACFTWIGIRGSVFRS
jgi:hypothetical protein